MEKPTNAEIEMRWIDAWNDLYDLTSSNGDMRCQLPDGSLVSIETCKGWLQDSVYTGFDVKLQRGQHHGHEIIIATRQPCTRS